MMQLWAWTPLYRELKHQTFLVPRTPTGSIFAAWQPLRMSRRSWAAVTDFKTRVLRLKPEVQILGSSKSIRHTKVEILRLKSCFLRKKETKLNANLWKAFSTELFCRRSWWFHVVLLNDLHLAIPSPEPVASWSRGVATRGSGSNRYRMSENFSHPVTHVQKLQISLLMLITDFCPSPPISFPEAAILLVSDRDRDLWDNPFAREQDSSCRPNCEGPNQ